MINESIVLFSLQLSLIFPELITLYHGIYRIIAFSVNGSVKGSFSRSFYRNNGENFL
uniref:Uncharacterized protein n=1 Tax=Rhizophagus irregularis (strain DAOM 181602 / DAOM 197198 / MUCL 43194) TaxID=747089 RepID=U9TTA4_RHIID